MRKLYNQIYDQDIDVDVADTASGWIQWKGTDVCIDLQCQCGHQGHFDGEFFYGFECPQCHAKYAVGQNIKLIKLNEEEIEYFNNDFKTCELEVD